jgi:hypothetical protein
MQQEFQSSALHVSYLFIHQPCAVMPGLLNPDTAMLILCSCCISAPSYAA